MNALLDHARVRGSRRQNITLRAISDAGALYGLEVLVDRTEGELRVHLSPNLYSSLKRDLRTRLYRLTQAAFDAHNEAERAARTSLRCYAGNPTGATPIPTVIDRIFRCFPALRTLWRHVIFNWCDSTAELFERFTADCDRLPLLVGWRTRNIAGLSLGLSDCHNRGRAVAILNFEHGSVVYKPRSGVCDAHWFSLLAWLNSAGVSPPFRILQIVDRGDYHWAEPVARRRMRTAAERRRFFVRAGALACLGYLLRAKDWHRDNLIVEGDQPVIVDAEALWHVFDREPGFDPHRLITEIMLFSTNDRPVGPFGPVPRGGISPCLGTPIPLHRHSAEIVDGFRTMWRFIFESADRRDQFFDRIRLVAQTRRRHIRRATAFYYAMLQESLTPHAMSSSTDRLAILEQRCGTSKLSRAVVRDEVRALWRADIPFFTTSGVHLRSNPEVGTLDEATSALRRALTSTQLFEARQPRV